MEPQNSSQNEILYDSTVLKQYLKGTLSKEQMEEIAKALNESEELSLRLEGLRFLLDQEGEEGAEAFLKKNWERHRSTLLADEPIRDSEANASYSGIRGYAIAASIALLLGLGAYFLSTKRSPVSLDLLMTQEIEKPFPLLNTLAVRSGTSEKSQWQKAYEVENYSEVATQLAEKDSLGELERFYLGLSYLYTQQFKTALTQFDQVIQINHLNGFLEQARWFKALTQMELQQPDSAQALLEIILLQEKHYKKVEAAKLLQSLPDE
ncbi:MAG: hypothetical protein AAF694_01295 [Bacteroidota bacterium]